MMTPSADIPLLKRMVHIEPIGCQLVKLQPIWLAQMLPSHSLVYGFNLTAAKAEKVVKSSSKASIFFIFYL